MFSDVSVVACKAATAVHDKMKLLSSDSMIIGLRFKDHLNYNEHMFQNRPYKICWDSKLCCFTLYDIGNGLA
jgi:hypothetical protein